MAVATGQRLINLRDDPPLRIIAVGVDRRHRADAPGGGPCAAAGVVGGRDALAAFDQRPHLAPAVQDGLEALEQTLSPAFHGSISGYFSKCSIKSASERSNEAGPGIAPRPGRCVKVRKPERLAIATIVAAMMVIGGNGAADHCTDDTTDDQARHVAIVVVTTIAIA